MKLVNKVSKFVVVNKTYFELTKLAHKVYKGKPAMVVFKTSKNTILVFRSLKGRIMGEPGASSESLAKMPFNVINLEIQTLTYTHKLAHEINLLKLSHPFHYEGELFPAGYYKDAGIHVNIFHTGNIVLTGVKTETQAKRTILLIETLICPFYVK